MNKLKIARVVLGLAVAWAGASCATQPANTGTPPATTTHTPLPLTPTRTPVPSATALPGLTGNRPYLMTRQRGLPDNTAIMIYDADGVGRQTLQLPPGGHVGSRLRSDVSPDGQWLVFYTGDFESGSTSGQLPITLNLLNLRDGTVRKLIDVVSKGYANKLDRVTEQLKRIYPNTYNNPTYGTEWVSGSVISAFQWGIYSVAWSPDSQRLAFAAQIDGNSSDVYVYDLKTSAVQRAEDSLQSVEYIEWSPDGKHLVFENSIPGNIYMGSELHALIPGPQAVKNPKTLYPGTWSYTAKWLSPTSLLVADGSDTGGSSNLRALNVDTGESRPLWRDGFSSYAIDYSNRTIAINASEFAKSENWGLYLVTFDGKKQKIFDGLYWLTLFFRGGESHRFLAEGLGSVQPKVQYPMAGDVVAIGLDGVPGYIGKFNYDKISISPDQSWLAMYDEQNLYLYDKEDKLVNTLPIPGIEKILWRPDSQAIFYSTTTELCYLSIPTGAPQRVDRKTFDQAVWLP